MEQLIKNLEAKVTSLEDKDRSRESVILDLRRDIINVQKENFNLQREVASFKDEQPEVKRLHKKNLNLQMEVTALRDELADLISLKSKVKYLEGISKDLSDFKKLRSLFNHMVVKAHGLVDSGAQIDSGGFDGYQKLEKRLEGLENRFDDSNTKLDDIEKSLQDNTDQNKIIQDTHNKQIMNLQMTFGDTKTRLDVVDKGQQDNSGQTKIVQGTHNKQITDLQKITDSHKQEIDSIHKSLAMTRLKFCSANIKPSQHLVENVRIKLDACEVLGLNKDGWLDSKACYLKPQQDCLMNIAWRFCQFFEGEMRLHLVSDVGGVDYLGKTTSSNDLCQGLVQWTFKAGQKCWIEVERTKGKAEVGWCYFTAWVLE